jgi:tetratricopeptide (TPR) repeat protein
MVATAEARTYKRRERQKYECRPSQEPANADLDKARRLWESGMIYYDSQEYNKARADLQTAYDLSHLPEFLINLAQVHAKLENYPEAIRQLEAYIQECPGAPDVPIASQRIEELRVAQAIKEGAKPPPTRRRLPPTASLVLIGTGVTLLIAGAGTGGAAIAAGKQVGNSSNNNTLFTTDLQSAEKRGHALQAAAISLDVVGALTLAIGSAWALSWLYEQKTGMSLAISPRLGGMVLSGGF